MDALCMNLPSFWCNFIELSKALITPLVAVITAFIAWQQWLANKRKIDMDLFDRRFHVYEEVQKLLQVVMQDSNISLDNIRDFWRSMPESEFLFGPEISEYIKELHQRGVRLNYFKSQYRDSSQPHLEGYDHNKVVEGAFAENTWFFEQFEQSKKLFKKCLDISR